MGAEFGGDATLKHDHSHSDSLVYPRMRKAAPPKAYRDDQSVAQRIDNNDPEPLARPP